MRRWARVAGRNPDVLDVAYWMRTRGRPVEEVLADIPRMRANGVTVGEFLFAPYAETPVEVPAFLAKLARALEPYAALSTPSGV